MMRLRLFIIGGANIAWGNNEANDIANTINNLDAYNLDYIWDDSKGSRVQPFAENDLNRVTICIAE